MLFLFIIAPKKGRIKYEIRFFCEKTLSILLIILIFTLSAPAYSSKTKSSGAEDLSPTITNPDDLQPENILDDMNIDAPPYVENILRDSDVVFTTHFFARKEFFVFYERGNCPDYGCSVVVFSHDNNRLFDPLIFFSKGELVGPETLIKLRFLSN